MATNVTPTKTFSRIALSSNETVCIECGNEITDSSKRRKLFNVLTKTSVCKNLERIIGRQLNLDSCLSNNVCRNCVDKNTTLLKKVDSVREQFNVVEADLIEKNHTTVTKRQRDDDCDQREDVARVRNPVKRRVVFSTNEFVTISNQDQESQTKPENSEESLESSDVSSVTVSLFLHPVLLYTQWFLCFTKLYLHCLIASIIHIFSMSFTECYCLLFLDHNQLPQQSF
jgi:hypothetical protein